MTGRERRLLRMLCMTTSGGGGDKPWEEMTWDDVIAATKNGKYKNFEIGAMKELDLGSEGIVHMQIVGIDADELADGSGYAPLTFISKELLKTSHRMNETATNLGGWELSEMRTYLQETVKMQIPTNVAFKIKEVKKYSYVHNPQQLETITTDGVWIPSGREINLPSSMETMGPQYYTVFPNATSRIKGKLENEKAEKWFLRSSNVTTNSFRGVAESGGGLNAVANVEYAIALGFCL